MSKWFFRHGGKASRNRRSGFNQRPNRNPGQLRRTKRKQHAIQVEKSISSEETPSESTLQERSLYGSFSGHGHDLDLVTAFPGFNPTYNTKTTCNKCNILAQELKNRPRSYEELFQMAVNNMLRNSCSKDLEVQTQDSSSKRQQLHRQSGNKCSKCQVLGSESHTTHNIYGHSHFPASFYRSTLSGIEQTEESCTPYQCLSVVDRYDSLIERSLQSTYCKMCEDRGICYCNRP